MTVVLPFRVRVQVEAETPVHAPPQEEKVEPVFAVAVKVMAVPWLMVEGQVVELQVTVPEPVPWVVTATVYVAGRVVAEIWARSAGFLFPALSKDCTAYEYSVFEARPVSE